MIRSIVDTTGVKIDVEDDGRVNIFASDQASADRAMQMVSDIAAVAEVGKTYLGKVVRLVDFGAFVEIFPGTDGLLHISRDLGESREAGARRAKGRRSDHGQGPGARRQQDQAEPESCTEGTARKNEEGTGHSTTRVVRSFVIKGGTSTRRPAFVVFATRWLRLSFPPELLAYRRNFPSFPAKDYRH